MKWPFRILALLVVLALVAGMLVALRTPPLAVEVAHVVRGELAQKVTDDGHARVRERYTVSAPVQGTLARIELHEGDVVEPGVVLARLLPLATPLLDPEARKAAEIRLASTIDGTEQAKAAVARASAAKSEAAVELSRSQSLAAHEAISSTQLDQALLDAHVKEAELASATFAQRVAEHEIAQARAALARFQPGAGKSEQLEITAPVHGVVLHVFHRSEGVVAAGTALLEVGDPAALEIVADVLSQDAVEIRPGMPAAIEHWGGEAPLKAKVRLVEPSAFTKTSSLGVDEQRVNVVFDLDGSPERWKALGDGFAVEIEITTWSKADALQIPTSALFREDTDWVAFVVDGNRAHLRNVDVGHRGPLESEILGGLQTGDLVVIHPGAAVRDGARVLFR
jgi:HlyD family secretion protein